MMRSSFLTADLAPDASDRRSAGDGSSASGGWHQVESSHERASLLPFQLHRADTLQFVVSSSNAGLFYPPLCRSGKFVAHCNEARKCQGPSTADAGAGPFRGRILATPPSNYCHSILLEENIERVAILNDDVVGNKGAEVALAISVAVSQNAERVT